MRPARNHISIDVVGVGAGTEQRIHMVTLGASAKIASEQRGPVEAHHQHAGRQWVERARVSCLGAAAIALTLSAARREVMPAGLSSIRTHPEAMILSFSSSSASPKPFLDEVYPAATLCPPPPKLLASVPMSTSERDLSDTLTRPSGCSLKRATMWCPRSVRRLSMRSSVSFILTPKLSRSACETYP